MAALLMLGACVRSEEMMMFSDCKMTPEVVATATGAGYRLDVMASPVLCVDPTIAQDLWPYAAALRVTNTGAAPVEITYQAGATASFSFRAQRVSEPRDPDDGDDYDSGPIDLDAGQTVTSAIAPGAFATLTGDATYILGPIDLSREGLRPSGIPVGPEERFDRTFRVEFLADFRLSADGRVTTVSETLPALLRVIVRDPSKE
jgi:hypothetical protein